MLLLLHVGSGAGRGAGSGVFLAGFAGGNHMLDGAFFALGSTAELSAELSAGDGL